MDTEGRYEVVEENHGEGGFGKVSKQRDKFLDRLVAVKELNLLSDQSSRERFDREARTLAKMSHPNVPAIYDVKFYEDQMRIYFEFIEGETLRSIIDNSNYPTVEEARRWFSHVAWGLGHAHSLDIIHRDVKPDNIIISSDRRVAFLVDFGIALTADEVETITKKGYVVGTPAYMSPEQRAGRDLTPATDFYSLGITLYETIAGHLPQPGDYQSLADANEAIPPAIDDLIKSCLQTNPEDRISSAGDFVFQIKTAVRSDAPLSQLLTEGRLHELLLAIRPLSAEDFTNKPIGQKLLIINRLKDLLRIDKPELSRATVELIEVLVRVARHETSADYRSIVDAAFEWGFEKSYGETWQGNQTIRDSLVRTSKIAHAIAHQVLAESYLAFTDKVGLEKKPGWYYHDLRELAMSLLANPECGEVAQRLAEIYDKVNEISHQRVDED
ncbi:MAG: serine/threonine protein kinase [Anaerolineae bacterium]|nr:serine/threonine protein kinase [Anaerolineae bacterium]